MKKCFYREGKPCFLTFNPNFRSRQTSPSSIFSLTGEELQSLSSTGRGWVRGKLHEKMLLSRGKALLSDFQSKFSFSTNLTLIYLLPHGKRTAKPLLHGER